jgi:fucose permease
VLIFGFLLTILACISFIFTKSFIAVVILFFLVNAGFGCFEVAVNSLGAQIFVRNSAVMMNLMHLFYGLGSSAGPKYAGWILIRDIPWQYTYFYSLILIVSVFIFLCFSSFPQRKLEDSRNKASFKDLISSKKIWLFVGVLGFCEVIELGTGNWLVNFLQQVRGMDAGNSSFYLTLFFITFTIGRLVGGYLAEKLGYVQIIFYFTIITIVLFIGGLILDNKFAFLFSLMGFFVSIMFPTVMAIIMKEFTVGTSSVMGFIITVSGSVNMVSNWVVGKTNDYLGVFTGFSSLAVYTGLILVFLTLLDRKLTFNKPGIIRQNQN